MEVLVQHENHMWPTLPFSKDKKALSTTIERLTGWEVLSSSWSPQGFTEHYQNWHKKPHPSCKAAKKHLNCVTGYVLSLSKSCFYLEDLGIYQAGLLKPGLCSESLQNPATASSQSHLCPWCFVCICGSHVSMIFSAFTFHSLTAKASSARLWLSKWVSRPLDTHFAGCTMGCTSQGELHTSLPCTRSHLAKLNSQDCVKHKTSRLVCAGSSCYTAMCAGHQGKWELRKWIASVKGTSFFTKLWRKIQGGKLGTRGRRKWESKESSMPQVWAVTQSCSEAAQCFTSLSASVCWADISGETLHSALLLPMWSVSLQLVGTLSVL